MRAMNNLDGGRVSVKRYCARGHACWAVVVLLGVAGVIAFKLPALRASGAVMALGAVALVLVAVAALLVAAEAQSGVEVTDEGMIIRQWPHLDRFVPWRSVTGVRWRHAWWRWLAEHIWARCQPGAHGCVELEFTDEEGRARREPIANYIALGRPPASVTQMIEEIAERARLTDINKPPAVWYPRFEYTEWHRARA